MKKSLLIIACLMFGFVSAQEEQNRDIAGTNGAGTILRASNSNNGGGVAFYMSNPPREIDGTIHLFDEWDKSAVIHTVDSQKFLLKNVNLNIRRNTFETKVSVDSVFAFNFNNVDKFVIDGKTYKNYYWNDDNRVYEIIYEAKDWSIIKGFKIVEVTGSANPMLNRSRDRMVRKMFYYIKDENGINPFILKKRKVLKLVSNGDATKSARIANYAKSNKLSYKREDDLRKIIEFGLKN